MILAYRVFTTFLYPFLFIFIYYRKILKKENPKRFKEKILVSHYRINKKDKSKLIWFHAASIGEFKSIIPIISRLNIKNRNLKFLVSTLEHKHKSNIPKIFLAVLGNIIHLLNEFEVNLALMRAIGILYCLVFNIKLGQISDSTRKILFGFHKFKNLSIKKGTSKGK